ncbi:phosphate starvation-inducible protein PsiF [Afipia sp. Root123D2]|uniref:PsiF family protein n=1 Tax=Afipia sp. Root123D2 TaxID=1736436 RepID=UPI0006FC8AB4|nr:PsiF family protein [Afipia sp. Root123D2]KQW18933.1 phosphate starvation-inducible protein PsiF [Afipia sp. Root123D2]
MMKISSFCLATAVTSFLLAGSAFAQTTPAPAAKPAATAPKAATTAPKAATTTPKAAKPRTAASLECSKQADAKGLHGKERKKFRSECKRNASKAN